MRGLCLAALLTGCGIVDFDVSQEVPEQRINGSVVPDVLASFFQFPIDIDIQAEIEAMETGPIDSVKLKSLTLDITATSEQAPDTDDWSFVDSVDVFVESRAPGSSLPRVKIAHVMDPGAVHTMRFQTVGSVNLIPYLNEGSRMTADGMGVAPPDDVTYGGEAVFRVHPL